ncbi:MAG: glycoside hydrolase family 28 protein [Planctomycetota bacterium]|jgi:polygalacturonase
MYTRYLLVLFLTATVLARPAVPASMLYAAHVHDVRSFGAVGDGKRPDTAAIQAAIDAAKASGGGTVHFPAGTYLSETLILASHVTLRLDAGAVLLSSTDPEGFRSRRGLVYAENADHITIAGRGIIEGQGGVAKGVHQTEADDERVLRAARARGKLLLFVRCTNVRIDGVTLRNSPSWMQHYFECENVLINGITVYNHCNHFNDGLNIDNCRNVHISNCTITSGDDAIVLKSRSGRFCENVTITNCVVSSHSNGVKLGTESHGGFRNITVTNCVVTPVTGNQRFGNGARQGLAGLVLATVDGAVLERVTISNMAISGTIAPIFVRLGNRGRKLRPDMEAPPVGRLRGIAISNIIATEVSNVGCAISGLPGHPIEDLTLSNISITFGAMAELVNHANIPSGGTREDASREIPEKADAYPECTMFGKLPAYGFYIRHAEGITLHNIRLSWTEHDQRPALFCEDVGNLSIDGLRAKSAKDAAPVILLNDVRTALIRGCMAAAETNVFMGLRGKTESISLIDNHLNQAVDIVHLGPGVPAKALFQTANSTAP